MSTFTYARTATTTQYNLYVGLLAGLQAAKDAITALGARPTYPVDVVIDADWNAVTTAIIAYDNQLVILNNALKNAQDNARQGEKNVIFSLGYISGADYGVVYDQWVQVQLGAGPTQHYIGFSQKSTYLTVITSMPTQKFPLF